jgi:hypothetical protein
MSYRSGKVKVMVADGQSGGKGHQRIKKQKRRVERRKAKRDPECTPTYGRYDGYET